MYYAFYKGREEGFFRGFFDWVVRFWMRGEYSHVEAILQDHGDGTYTIASSVPGVGIRIATQTLPKEDWDIFEGPGNAEDVRKWYEQNLHADYDYLGLLGFVLRRVVGEKSSYFCSESVCYAIGCDEPWRFDPNALADLVKMYPRTV